MVVHLFDSQRTQVRFLVGLWIVEEERRGGFSPIIVDHYNNRALSSMVERCVRSTETVVQFRQGPCFMLNRLIFPAEK